MRRITILWMLVWGGCCGALVSGCGKSPSSPEPATRADAVKASGETVDGAVSAPVVAVATGEPQGLGVVPIPDTTNTVEVPLPGKSKLWHTVMLPDGSVYEGESINGVAEGTGTVVDMNGTRQQGEWRRGQAYRVTGTWVAPDGTKEVGTWNNDGDKSGGTIQWKDGRFYKGEWRVTVGLQELPEGMGTMTWPEGRTYVGHFRGGKMDGTGKMTYPGGKIEDGTWKQDEFVGAAKPAGN